MGEKIFTINDFEIGDVFTIKDRMYYKKQLTVTEVVRCQLYCEDVAFKGEIYCFTNENLDFYSKNLTIKHKANGENLDAFC